MKVAQTHTHIYIPYSFREFQYLVTKFNDEWRSFHLTLIESIGPSSSTSSSSSTLPSSSSTSQWNPFPIEKFPFYEYSEERASVKKSNFEISMSEKSLSKSKHTDHIKDKQARALEYCAKRPRKKAQWANISVSVHSCNINVHGAWYS